MARSRYEYSTSPRKLEPEYKPQQKQNKKRKLHVVEDLPRQGIKISTEQKKKRQYLPSGAAYKRCEQPGDFQKRYTCQPVFEKLYKYSIVCKCLAWRY